MSAENEDIVTVKVHVVEEAEGSVVETKTQEEAHVEKEVKQEEVKKPEEKKDVEENELHEEYLKCVSNVPEEVKPRFVALKHISDKREKLEEELQKKIDELERQYHELFKPLNNLRDEIVNGTRDPTSEELAELEKFKEPKKLEEKLEIDFEEIKKGKGLPGFWLQAMKNNDEVGPNIKECDHPILKHLVSVQHHILEDNNFSVEFHFSPNEYFKNTVLTKKMVMDKNDPEMCKESIGTEIEWLEGKNVTEKKVVKKKKHKKTKVVKETVQIVEQESFFNYFKSWKAPEKEDEDKKKEEEIQKIIMSIENDIRFAEEISNEVIPKAIFYFFGIIEEEDNGEMSESSEEEEVKPPPKKKHRQFSAQCSKM